METTRRDALGLIGGAAAAAAMGAPAMAQGARNLGSKTKTLFWVASCTPCDKNLKFDPAAFKDVLAWFKHNGADGVVVLGTTGEYPSFGTAERKQVMEVAGKNKDGMNIICSSGTSNFTETIELSKHAADHGAEGLLVIPPFYYKKPALAGLVKYYSLLFDAVPQSLAVNLYHIPSNSAVPISHELLKALKHYPNLAGIKDSEEDMPEYKQFVADFPDLNMRTGTDTKLEFALSKGGAIGSDSSPRGIPKFRTTLAATYVEGPWQGTVQSRIIGSSKLNNAWGPLDVDNNAIPAVAYLDLRASYKWNDNISLYGAIDNVINTPPPIPAASSAALNYYDQSIRDDIFDAIGRSFRIGVRVKY